MSLRHLEQLTEELPSLIDLVRSSGEHMVEYETATGAAIGINLYSTPMVSVQRVFMSAGSALVPHQHPDEREWLIVYEGKLEVRYDSKVAILDVGDSVYFNPGSPHSAKALKDTWFLGITVPRAEGYPHGK